MTENPDNLLMWAHYARNHTGLCIEFDTSEDFLLATELYQVRYNENNLRPTINLTKKDFSSNYLDLILEKSSHWSYENEWRLIRPEMAQKTIKINPNAITGLTYGAKIEQATKDAISSIIRNRQERGLNALKIMQAQLDRKFYKLNIE